MQPVTHGVPHGQWDTGAMGTEGMYPIPPHAPIAHEGHCPMGTGVMGYMGNKGTGVMGYSGYGAHGRGHRGMGYSGYWGYRAHEQWAQGKGGTGYTRSHTLVTCHITP